MNGRRLQLGRQGAHLKVPGAGHWPVPLARLRLGKSGLDISFVRYETVSSAPHNLAITEVSSFVNASVKQVFAHASAGAEGMKPALSVNPQTREPHHPIAAGLRMRQTAPLWGTLDSKPHSGRWTVTQ